MSTPAEIAAWLHGTGLAPNSHVDWVEPHPEDHDDLDAWNAARAAYALPPLTEIPRGYGHRRKENRNDHPDHHP